ncbi:hypothetical protein SynBIOSU31_00099 [Synechococcus sp. BIOS-U3-1]|uniref:hypothetical protein n=1 Tax=Synechococcus sp. BIOS-U3-1 TaxID=1400865 RepID=UPI0016469A2A|nr:hypothetical protein [Synechococcus sp. BIOS-U3-1]QNI57021.1 hypothetical protein SynBIOSU31_00099 [Synechococcus sp. BIOS-U3-1]
MLISDRFIWLHLPKTGGTSTARLFRDLDIPLITVDPDQSDTKHESIENRLNSLQYEEARETIITTRQLASWLLSDWHHKTKKMGLTLPFDPVKSGLFYSLRLGGTWVAADYWIHYFKATSCSRVVRLEHLEKDSNRLVLPLLPQGTKPLKFPSVNTNNYSHKIEKYFGRNDLKRIHQNNPAWSSWENKIYGSISSINQLARFKAKLSNLNKLN